MSIQHMPLGDVSMIGTTSTFFTCIYGRIFLKESLRWGHVINIFIVIGGLLLIVQVKIFNIKIGYGFFHHTLSHFNHMVNNLLFFAVLLIQPSFVFGAGNSFYTDKPNAIIAAIIMVTFSTVFEPNIFVLLRVLKGTCQTKFGFDDTNNIFDIIKSNVS